MFKQSISVTPLTSESANLCFQNITGEPYGGDTTFLASLRALVAPRLPKDETVRLVFGRSDYSAENISSSSADAAVRAICGNWENGPGQIYVHSLRHRDEESNVACFEVLKAKFTDVYKGWQRLEKVTDFYHKSFRVLCFVNAELKSTVLFVDGLNLQKLHYLQCSILAILPWYFDPKCGIDETELELVKSLRERTSENYEACLKKIAQRYDFESARIRSLLAGFETKFEKIECERIRREISSIDRDIASLNQRYAECNKNRNNACIRLVGLEQKIADGSEESEIMDYFLCNRKVVLKSVTNTEIEFVVRDYLSYYDEDAVKRYIKNKNGFVYYNCGTSNGRIRADQMEKLMRAIFIDEKLRIKFCAAYRFDLNGSVRALTEYTFGTDFDDFMPNPHIDRYRCMGDYESKINNMLVKHDYVGAIEQCIASAKSLNWHDSTVMGEFFSQICGRGSKNIKCIELPDGHIVSPKDAIKWLEDQETAANKPTESTESSDASTVVHGTADETTLEF